jgi:hypothetical protein
VVAPGAAAVGWEEEVALVAVVGWEEVALAVVAGW